MKTAGGGERARMAWTRLRVASIRLSSICVLRAAVHRPSPIDAPARFTMADAASSVPVHVPAAPSGVQAATLTRAGSVANAHAGVSAGRRDSTTTSCPAVTSASTSGVPRNPPPPATTIFTRPPCWEIGRGRARRPGPPPHSTRGRYGVDIIPPAVLTKWLVKLTGWSTPPAARRT